MHRPAPLAEITGITGVFYPKTKRIPAGRTLDLLLGGLKDRVNPRYPLRNKFGLGLGEIIPVIPVIPAQGGNRVLVFGETRPVSAASPADEGDFTVPVAPVRHNADATRAASGNPRLCSANRLSEGNPP